MELSLYNSIREKYGGCSSWAIWTKRDKAKKEKTGMGDIGFFDTLNSGILKPNIVLVGLNISGKLDRPFCNFHPSHSTAHDYKTRYALEDTEFWGAYMTDIIKDYEEKISSNVKMFLKNNPDFEKENVERFERELSDIQAVNPTIIAFGNDAHRILNKHFKNKYKIYKVPHYSSNISKEQLREKFIEIQQKKQ
jgi:hypothetical protein